MQATDVADYLIHCEVLCSSLAGRESHTNRQCSHTFTKVSATGYPPHTSHVFMQRRRASKQKDTQPNYRVLYHALTVSACCSGG